MCRAALSPPGPEGLLRCLGTARGGSDEHVGPSTQDRRPLILHDTVDLGRETPLSTWSRKFGFI